MADTGGIALNRIVDDLGSTLVEVAASSGPLDATVRSTVIFEPGDDADRVRDALVLGVGLSDSAVIADLVGDLAAHHATALVVKANVRHLPDVAAAVQDTGLPVISLRPGVTWEQLTLMVGTLLAGPRAGLDSAHTLGGATSGDLFALAGIIASTLEAPVTIEDPSFNVLAFAGEQDEADDTRVTTILRRRVPQRMIEQLEQSGTLRTIYESNDVVELGSDFAGGSLIATGRSVVAVRAGGEVLGAIWVAGHDVLDDDQRQFLKESARLAALHLLALRSASDLNRTYLAENVAAALDGGGSAAEALTRLDIAMPALVVAVGLESSPSDDAREDDRSALYRLSELFAAHLQASVPKAASAVVGNNLFAVVPVGRRGAQSPESMVRTMTAFVSRVPPRYPVVAGVGPVAHGVPDLAASATAATRAVRVMASGGRARTVELADRLAPHALLMDAGDLAAARGAEVTGLVAALRAYDVANCQDLLPTLEAWLEAGCDAQRAAEAMFVHPNTFRYRLKRVAAVGDVDLEDPDTRFFAQLQLRLVRAGALVFPG